MQMKNFLSALALGLTLAATAQPEVNVKKDYKKADTYWYDENYDEALKIYKELQNFDNTPFLKFKIGDCYLNGLISRDAEKAVKYLKEACDSISTDIDFNFDDYKNRLAPTAALRSYGVALRTNYQFDEAITVFKKYEDLLKDNLTEEEKAELVREKQICNTGKLLVANPVNITVTSLGKQINGKFPEYAPVLSADEKTLIFTSRRGVEGDDKDPFDFRYYEDIYISKKDDNGNWGTPSKISENINTKYHEATIGLSVDGQQLLIYSAKDDKNGNIYYSKLDGDNWSVPVSFDALNSNASETHACFSADGNTIYFTSNRKGGFGGYDIYKVIKLPNGNWSLPQNLGPKINTKFDDRAPFIHPDGVSLFFASEGHETMGGFDIFQATLDEDGVWSTPENIGYPINTTGDDLFYVTSVDGKRSYYSSLKADGEGDKDIYLIELPKQEVNPLTIMSGTFTLGDKEGNVPEDAQIIVTDNETGEIVGIYKPNKKTGKYLFILPPGKNYNVTYEAQGYLFKSENLIVPKNSTFSSIKKEIKLAPIKANSSIVLNNVFFEFDSDKLTDDSKIELDKLFNLLANNPDLNVEIQGHTDSKGNDGYNLKLSQRRAESVRRYVVNKGIDPKKITAKGYGETQPIAKNENSDGTDNPEGRALNRRIELKILSSDGSHKNTVNDIYVPDELKKKK